LASAIAINRGRMKILITGASGFIGQHLVQTLAKDDFDIVAFARKPLPNLKKLRVNIIVGDIRNGEKIREAAKSSDSIIHLAAFGVNVNQSIEHPLHTFDVNVMGTLTILELARKFDLERIIFASSSSIYGHPQYVPIDENHPLNPIHPYAASKAAAEHACMSYHKIYSLPVVCLRLSAVYGSGGHTYIDNFINLITNNAPLIIPEDRSYSRNYTYIKDCIYAFQLSLAKKGIEGEAINIAGSEHFDLNTIIDKLTNNYKNENFTYLKQIDRSLSDTEKKRTRYKPIDINKAKKFLGYYPKYNLDRGIIDYKKCIETINYSKIRHKKI